MYFFLSRTGSLYQDRDVLFQFPKGCTVSFFSIVESAFDFILGWCGFILVFVYGSLYWTKEINLYSSFQKAVRVKVLSFLYNLKYILFYFWPVWYILLTVAYWKLIQSQRNLVIFQFLKGCKSRNLVFLYSKVHLRECIWFYYALSSFQASATTFYSLKLQKLESVSSSFIIDTGIKFHSVGWKGISVQEYSIFSYMN